MEAGENLQAALQGPLEDGTVALRPLTVEDVGAIAAAVDREVTRWLPLPEPYTEADAFEFVTGQRSRAEAGESLNLAITHGDTVVGVIGVHFARARRGEAEIGYWVAPAARGHGVAARSIRLLAGAVFRTWVVHRIELLVQPDNHASRRAAERAGAAFEGIRRAGIRFEHGGEARAAAVYSLLPSDVL